MLAHGAGGGVERNFDGIAHALEDRRRLIGLDYPGSGSRPPAIEPLTLDVLADELVEAGIGAGFDSFPILGLSLGCAVAITAAARHPERVTGLVLTVGFARADAQLTATVDLSDALLRAGESRAHATFLLHASASPRTLAELSAEARERLVDETGSSIPAGMGTQLALAAGVDVTDHARGVGVPALVVVAGHDHMVLPSSTRRLAELIPEAELREYPEAGHIFTGPEERDWALDVHRFLSQHGL